MKEEIKKILTGKPSIDKPWTKWYSKEVLESSLPECTCYDYIFKDLKGYENRIALNYFGQVITYKQLKEKIDKTVLALLSYNVKEGDIVSIAMPSTPESVVLFYALNKIGAISNMIDPRTSVEGIIDYINEANSSLFFAVENMIEKVDGIVKNTKLTNTIIISPTTSLPLGMQLGAKALDIFSSMRSKTNPHMLKKHMIKQNYENWENFYKHSDYIDSKQIKYPEYQKNKTAVIVHTGGTTGKAKGVMLTNDNINCASYQCENAGYDFKPYHNWLNIMPPFIAYGVGNGLHLPLACKMEVILIPQFNPDEFADLLLEYKPNHMTGVPSHFGHLLENKKLKDADLSFILAPTVGGDKMEISLEEKTNKFLHKHACSYDVVKGYGMTEVSAAVAACTSNETNSLGSVGIPFSHTVISIFDPETGKELGYNEQGEVCITGPNTMLGYFNNQEETDYILRKHEDGKIWVHSGDLGYMNEDGLLFIIDRIKRIIVRHDGFKVFPTQIEDVLNRINIVSSSQVVGVLDRDYAQGKLPVASVILKGVDAFSLSSEDKEKIKAYLKNIVFKKLPEYAWPIDFDFRNEFPLTPIGKVDYKALEKELSKVKSKQLIK